MKFEIFLKKQRNHIKKQRNHILDNSYMLFYILITIYCITLSLFIFGEEGTSNQIKILIFGFVIPSILMIIGDLISKINIKRIK